MLSPHIAIDIPGRLRLRLPPRTPTEDLQQAVAGAPGVTRCTWSPRTRSLLVLYDPTPRTREAIADAIAQASGLAAPIEGPALSPGAARRRKPGVALATGVWQLFGEIDDGVQRATRGVVTLGGLLPVALTAWALAEMVRGRAAPLAWSSALWYAHGLFRDYQGPVNQD
jgi:hypothetical protein